MLLEVLSQPFVFILMIIKVFRKCKNFLDDSNDFRKEELLIGQRNLSAIVPNKLSRWPVPVKWRWLLFPAIADIRLWNIFKI